MKRSNLFLALLGLFLGAALADWLSTRDAHAQALSPSSGGATYVHPSAISLPNGIDSADGGTFVGKITIDAPGTGNPALRVNTEDRICLNTAETSCLHSDSSGNKLALRPLDTAAFECWGGGVDVCDSWVVSRIRAGIRIGVSGNDLTESYLGSATLDFGSIALGNCADLTLTVTNAAEGDPVAWAIPAAARVTGSQFDVAISSANTATVRHCCNGAATCDPGSGTFVVRSF